MAGESEPPASSRGLLPGRRSEARRGVVSGEAARLAAARAKADAVIAAVAELPDTGLLLRVAVTDVATGQRLATGFVTYETVSAPVLRLVTS